MNNLYLTSSKILIMLTHLDLWSTKLLLMTLMVVILHNSKIDQVNLYLFGFFQLLDLEKNQSEMKVQLLIMFWEMVMVILVNYYQHPKYLQKSMNIKVSSLKFMLKDKLFLEDLKLHMDILALWNSLKIMKKQKLNFVEHQL